MDPETRPAPDWAGDVSLGVDAWTGAREAKQARDRAQPPPQDPVAAGPDADPEQVARTILLDQLTGRARSRKELSDKLRSKDVPEDLATRLLDRFEEVGLVDDEAFARSWVAGRQAAKGLARRALAQELRRKGVDDEVAREVLDELSVSSGSGDVHVASADGAVLIKTGSGDLRVDATCADVAFTSGSGSLGVSAIRRGRVSAKVASGDVRVGVPGGVPVWTDISSLTGRIHSTLAGAGQPEEGQDHVEVRAATVSGNVSLVQV